MNTMSFRPIKNNSMKLTLLLAIFCTHIFSQDPDFHIYLSFGQSNMAGAGAIEEQDKTVDSRLQVMYPMIGCSVQGREFGKWYDAVPPLWGCPNGGLGPTDYFGRTMVQKLPDNIKIGVIVVAIPGCDIRLFDKTDFNGYDTYNYVPSKYNGSAYAWLMELAELAKKDGVIKGFLMHQGESMPDQKGWPGHVKRVYDNLVNDLALPATTPLLVGEVLYQSAGGQSGWNNNIIDTIGRVIQSAHVISAEGLTGKDQWHFTAASERIFGARYADAMLEIERTSVASLHNKEAHTPKSPISSKNGTLQISLSGTFSYTITSLSGAVMERGTGCNELSTSRTLTTGIYFFAIENSVTTCTGKVIVR